MMWPYIFILILLIPILAIILDSQVGRALAARLERGRIETPGDLAGERIANLEAEVDRLNAEVARLAEEGDFLHKLLTERAGGKEEDPRLPPGESPA
jgi:hypothetical protein